MGGQKDSSPSKNEIVRRFLAEANRIFESEGVAVQSTEDVFNAIGVAFNFDVVSYMRKLDFIREESGSMFSLTDRGREMAQME